jgi:two-component system osmolarity sensor histidine kinase EnvZ
MVRIRPFVRLQRRLRDLLPKGLYWRTLLIFVLPITVMQIAVLFVFFDTHWERTGERMTDSAAGTVALVVAVSERDPAAFNGSGPDGAMSAEAVEAATGFNVALRPGAVLSPVAPPRLREPIDQLFVDALRARLGERPFAFDARAPQNLVRLQIPVRDGVLDITVDRWRTVPTRGYQFLILVVAATALLTTVSIVFIRNQIRPIERLSKALEAFGRGREMPAFKPRGALEVRAAANAVLDMRDRITRHIEQRTVLLAGVSHDLRTPLTRLRLQLALMPSSADVDAMRGDLDDMEHTLDEYLTFARGDGTDEPERTDLSELVTQVVAAAARTRDPPAAIHTVIAPGVTGMVRAPAVRRAVANIVENALTHARHIVVSLTEAEGDVVLQVDDDGPGIAETDREEAFKPFSRLETGRNRNRKGVGLGLAIARDVMRAHGGDITLGVSPAGGLRAELRLPA